MGIRRDSVLTMIATPSGATLDLNEAARFLGVHPNTLQAMAKSGQVQVAKIGRAWRFLDVDLIAYLRSQYATFQSQPHPSTLRHAQPQ